MKRIFFSLVALLALPSVVKAQASGMQTTTPEEFKPSGAFTMQFFADYYYQLASDTAALGSKGYYEPNARFAQAFDIRRVYLGYDYNFTKNIAAQLLLSHENGSPSNGDVVIDQNRGLYIKAANVRFKNAVPMSTLIIGQQGTAAFALTEQVWGYRSVEKTMMDFRGMAQSNDLGIQLTGNIDNEKMIGYSAMISNGNGAKAENDKYKKFAGEVNANLMENKIILEAYADYTDLAPTKDSLGSHDRSNATIKGMAAYMSDPITIGAEYALQTMSGQSRYVAYGDAAQSGLSVFARGYILPKQLNWFARFDMFDPDTKAVQTNIVTRTASSVRESFITAGIDWIPDAAANVHIMPNFWMNRFSDKSAAARGYEAVTVGRLTFFFKF
jgi:hypothetical protein